MKKKFSKVFKNKYPRYFIPLNYWSDTVTHVEIKEENGCAVTYFNNKGRKKYPSNPICLRRWWKIQDMLECEKTKSWREISAAELALIL